MFLAGYSGIRKIFDGYRDSYASAHGAPCPIDRLAYASLIYVGSNAKLAREGAEKLLWYMTSNKVTPHHSNPPGYHPPEVSSQFLRGATGDVAVLPQAPTLDDQMARGNVFAGTPDQVYEQIRQFWEYSGGFGHLIMMGQAGFVTREECISSMKLFSQEVLPRLTELAKNYDPQRMKAIREAQPDRPHTSLGSFGLEFVR